MLNIIKRPLISEKNSALSESNVFAFEVDRGATKEQIRAAVEKFFKVKVVRVNTSVCRGRATANRTGSRPVKYWKKAMVKLAAGEKISLFEGA
jgi:large subunit ribosomal protein L23